MAFEYVEAAFFGVEFGTVALIIGNLGFGRVPEAFWRGIFLSGPIKSGIHRTFVGSTGVNRFGGLPGWPVRWFECSGLVRRDLRAHQTAGTHGRRPAGNC